MPPTSSPGPDTLRTLGVGNGWDFDPPLPAKWSRRMRRVAAVHPSGAGLDLVWTITGAIGHDTWWASSQGAVVEFEPVVPPVRALVLYALLAQPHATQQQADHAVAQRVAQFWSPTPRTLPVAVRAAILDGQPEPRRQQLIDHMELSDRRHHALHLRRQQWARRRGWHPPAA